MSRPAYHFLVDVLLLGNFLAMLCVETMVQFIFPAPTQADGWLLWGLTYDRWSTIGFVCLCGFTLTTLVHLILQWGWVCKFIGSRVARMRGQRLQLTDGIQTLYGVGTLVGVLTMLLLLLTVASVMVQRPVAAG